MQSRAYRVGVKELAPLLLFLIWFFVSGAQTPLPLIHPPDSVSGGAERGRKVKTRAVVTGGLRLLFGPHWAYL
jgi:hypothetical protein